MQAEGSELSRRMIPGYFDQRGTEEPKQTVAHSRHGNRREEHRCALAQALFTMISVDFTRVPILGIDTVLVLASEIEPDLPRFPSARHFDSWLGLAPPIRTSSGQTLTGS